MADPQVEVDTRARRVMTTPRAAGVVEVAFAVLLTVSLVIDADGCCLRQLHHHDRDRLGLAPRWLSVLGLATGGILLLTAGAVPWIEIVFPGVTTRLS